MSALSRIFDVPPRMEVIGIRHGEKWHEKLATSEELARSTDSGDYFRVALDARDLNYAPYADEGEPEVRKLDDYGSDSAYRLSVEETEDLLRGLPEIRRELALARP